MPKRPILFLNALIVVGMLAIMPVFAQDDLPGFESGSCPFGNITGYDVDCGFVEVPESRDEALADENNFIRLAVARIHSSSDNPEPDAVIYLDGGPGGYTLDFAESYALDFAPILENRDVILFDQRGVGYSEPNLDCPELTELGYELLDDDITDEEAYALSNAVEITCLDRLVADGANMKAYTSAENAADVEAIITALGYEQINLFGISYGTRLALVVMRDFPEIVRSAVIDAVYPLDVDAYAELTPNADRAFNTLFNACAQDDACATTYTHLDKVFYDTVERLNTTPELVTFQDIYTEEERDVLVTGDTLINGLFSLLYQSSVIPDLPEAIYAAAQGNYDLFLDDMLFSLYFGSYFSESQYNALECYEEVNFSSYEAAAAASTGLPQALLDSWLPYVEDFYRLCNQWVDGTDAPIANQPVVSDIPTLLTVGEYDPITPPAWAQRAASSLSNSYLYEFPGVGHSAFYGVDCAQSIVFAFIQDPTIAPDSSCIDDIAPLQFAQAPVTSVNNVPFTDEDLAYSGIVPEGWEEVGDDPGVFTPDSWEQIPALAYRFPESTDEYVERVFVNGYGLEGLPESDDVVEAGGFTWTIYQIENAEVGIFSAFAFTESQDGKVVIIAIVAGSEEERRALIDVLLLPALDAFALLN
ncbi:MAG: alpha/beta fold hydrolase [Chitinophagaceae bacterium]|nr:alpha/beta fold hydrolase [Anaerolineae bacterium]